ncbi:MAG: cadherin domain-containing protein [Pseudomonadota bacterium]
MADLTLPTVYPTLQKLFVLCGGIAADTVLAPALAQQVMAAGNWDGLNEQLDTFLAERASSIGASALIIKMAQQGLDYDISMEQATALAAPILAGEKSWSEGVNEILALTGWIGDTLTNRAGAAQVLTDALVSQGKGGLYSGSALWAAVGNLLEGVTHDPATIVQAADSMQALIDGLNEGGMKAAVSDGHLAGATVFVDADGDARKDPGESTSTSDLAGYANISASAQTGTWVAFGGNDLISDGIGFDGVMTAPAGATVINPLTSLVQGLYAIGAVASAQAGSTLVVEALGLPSGLNLLNYDPIYQFAYDIDEPTAHEVLTASIQVANFLSQFSVCIDLVTNLNLTESANFATHALARAVAAGGSLDLTDVDVITGIIESALEEISGAPPLSIWATPINQLAQIIGASNQAAADAENIADLAQVTGVTQGGVVQGLIDNIVHGKPGTDAVLAFTGGSLQAQIAKAPLTGDLLPGIPVVPGGGGGGGGGLPNLPPSDVDLDNALFSLAENTSTAERIKVADIVVSDDGLGTNVITLSGADADAFEVDGDALYLKAGAALDFESQQSLAVDVTVQDPDLPDSTPVAAQYMLAIDNVDDTAPSITSAASSSIHENSGADQVVYQTTSVDLDVVAGQTSYSLAASGDAASFTIDGTTGVVRLTPNPNFEAKSSYSFMVLATDAAGNTGGQAVTLSIINRDESSPTITSGATATAINENTAGVVYTATASDSGDVSAGISFSLGGADAAFFSINSGTGAVTLLANADHETRANYSFSVIASDGVNTPDEQAVTLAVNDIDDASPTITSDGTANAIDENTGEDQVVYTATATDTDDDISAGISFSLGGEDADFFSIDDETGEVRLLADADHEDKSGYSFSVIASDGVTMPDEQAVTLAVNDLNDSSPNITSGGTAAAIDENTGGDQLVYTAIAYDPDVVGAGITFSLGGTDAEFFSIGSATGAVRLLDNPDHENQSSYSFTVIASDGVTIPAQQAVTLAINDINEAPTITSSSTATPLDERSGAVQIVYTVTASDPDDGAVVTYGLGDDADEDKFTINSSTGAVTLIEDPNFDTTESYSFFVFADDGIARTTLQVSLAVVDLDGVFLAAEDDYEGGPNGDTIYGGSGANEIGGNNGQDYINGRGGNDIIRGGKQTDTLLGGEGNDSLLGGELNDTLIGGNGNDTIDGEDGNDTILFEATAAGNGRDVITNFEPGANGDEMSFNAVFVASTAEGGIDSTPADDEFDGDVDVFSAETGDNTPIAGLLVIYDALSGEIGDVDSEIDIAIILNGGDDIKLAANEKAIIVAGAENSQAVYVWYVQNDADATVQDTEVALVAEITLIGANDIQDFHADNFSFY